MTYYTEQEARLLVIEAGHKLLQRKLVSRTWGNISARISDTEFIITPSGRRYENLTADELVKVTIGDLSYAGTIRPSSEKGVHADAYGLRKEARFIIHTHQMYASALSACDEDLPFAPCAHYGPPGTHQLRQCLCHAMAAHRTHDAFLMARHGALCLGRSCEEAFRLADELERRCQRVFAERTGITDEDAMVDAYCRSHRILLPYIDDFAQIVGPAALIRHGTVLTPDSDDAEAVARITLKNCAAALCGGTPLSLPDAMHQRISYRTSYSKQNTQNHK